MIGDLTLQSLYAVKPELYLAVMSLFLLLFGVFRVKKVNYTVSALVVAVLGFTGYLTLCNSVPHGVMLNGMFISDRFSDFAKCLILTASALVVLLSARWLREEGGRPFEFLVLLLLATLGMMLMVSANDMLALYMALEMSSLALYVLASFARDDVKSNEAGLKYFVLGALASGMMLFGISLIYGFAGTLNFSALDVLFETEKGLAAKGVVVGLVFMIIGFCFKLSAVPFHMWTPDVYEGAPTPVTAFFATAPKVAAMVLFVRLLMQPFEMLRFDWQQVVVFASVLSMLLGAFAAIVQKNIKRLLAYSSIGHVGFMLMGLATASISGVQSILIYLSLYIFMSLGMFACVMLMKRGSQSLEDIKDFSGLAQTQPLLAGIVAMFMFSMAGIPPLSGFFAKWYVLLAVLEAKIVWLAVVGVLASVVSGYYYLKIVKTMYFDAPPTLALNIRTPKPLAVALVLCVLVTAFFFLLPTPLVTQAQLAASALHP